METIVDSPATRDAPSSGVAQKKAAGDADVVRRRPSIFVLFQDLLAAFRAPGFWLYGARIDVSLRFRSQALGALWMVAGTLAFVIILGTIYSQVLVKSDGELYYAHLAAGFVLWLFLQQSLAQSTRLFKKNKSMIENGYAKYVDYVLRAVAANFINLAYNAIIVAGAIMLTPVQITTAYLVLLLTVPLFLSAVLGASLLLSVIGARYPDISTLVQTVLRLFFFVTPIIWMQGMGKGIALGTFIYANPFYYLVEIVRGPLVYAQVPWLEIGVVTTAVPIVWLAAAIAYARAKPYVPLWI